MADTRGDDLENGWRRYRRVADHPVWFTRWMLGRTLVVLAEPALTDPLLLSAQIAISRALDSSPLAPPVAVDSRVDMLNVRLTSAQARAVAALFVTADRLPDGDQLDDLQRRRMNPWGGFREAWLEHYNHVIDSEQGSAGMAETEVQSEVAGTVWKVHVQVGDAVGKDQELMILESMKMEIPVEAPCSGTVVNLLVAPEDGVEEDQVLLIIES